MNNVESLCAAVLWKTLHAVDCEIELHHLEKFYKNDRDLINSVLNFSNHISGDPIFIRYESAEMYSAFPREFELALETENWNQVITLCMYNYYYTRDRGVHFYFLSRAYASLGYKKIAYVFAVSAFNFTRDDAYLMMALFNYQKEYAKDDGINPLEIIENPKDISSFVAAIRLASTVLSPGKTVEYIKYFEPRLRNPKRLSSSAYLFFAASVLLKKEERYSEALEFANNAIKLWPEYGDAYYMQYMLEYKANGHIKPELKKLAERYISNLLLSSETEESFKSINPTESDRIIADLNKIDSNFEEIIMNVPNGVV